MGGEDRGARGTAGPAPGALLAAPFARGLRALRDWTHVPPVGTFPVEQALLTALAGVAGIYAGLAAGLFANFVALFQVVFYRPDDLLRALRGADPAWSRHFSASLREARWHPEYLAVALGVWLTARLVARLALSGRYEFLRPAVARPVRTIGWLAGSGLALYYPVLLLARFTGAFGTVHGGFLALVREAPWPLVVAMPALGALAAGVVVARLSPESGGHGVVEVIETANVRGRRIPGRVAFFKSLTAGLVIGSGGSAGREGPVVQIGSAVADELGRRFGLSGENLRVLLAAGGGAGIAASFNAPVGGAMFALEIILGDFGVRRFAPVVLAAATATVTGRALVGPGGELAHVPFRMESGFEILPYLLLGGLAAAVAVLYVRSVQSVEGAFARGPLARLRPELKPALGGLLVGLLGLAAPRVLGIGYDSMNAALAGELALGTLVLALAAKIAASGLTLGSGAPGGSFFPAVFMGGMLGGAVGNALHRWVPWLVAGPGPYAAVGMAAVVAGAAQAPLTGAMLLFELTGTNEIILPLLVACGASVAGAHWALGGSMYTLALRARGVPTGPGSRRLLREIAVAEAMSAPVETLPAGATLDEIVERLRERPRRAFPVLNAAGALHGLLVVDDLRPLEGQEARAPVVAGDVCRLHPPTAVPGEALESALARMVAEGAKHLPVLDPAQEGRLVGILSRSDILRAYERARASLSDPRPAG